MKKASKFRSWQLTGLGDATASCNVSETGARLSIRDSIEGLKLKEFFLLLSSTGLTYRRCELAWVNGEEIGAKFVTAQTEKKKRTGRSHNNNLEL